MLIAFIGSNPSNKSLDLNAFSFGTRSRRTLEEWIGRAELCTTTHHLTLHNICNNKTHNNRALTASEIAQASRDLRTRFALYDKVIALGTAAHRALQLADIPHLAIDHPSGLNRNLNNKQHVEAMIQKLKEYVQE